MENKKTEVKKLSQIVEFSKDDQKELTQIAIFDPSEDWVHIVHAGNEISLCRDNWEKLCRMATEAIYGNKEESYNYLKNLKQKDVSPILKKMTEIQLTDLLRQETDTHPLKYYRVRPFAQYVLSEIFKRSGLGYKQLQRLSTVQSKFVENMGISTR